MFILDTYGGNHLLELLVCYVIALSCLMKLPPLDY